MSDKPKSGKLTVFKSDRHEDWGGIVFVTFVVSFILVYMAYFTTSVKLKAAQDGKITAVKVAPDQMVKKGEALYTLEYKEKKWTDGKLQEKVVQKDQTAKANGKVLKVSMQEGAEVKKGKTVLLELEHEKGTLP